MRTGRQRRRLTWTALLALAFVVTAACGQKAGVVNLDARGEPLPPGAQVDESGNLITAPTPGSSVGTAPTVGPGGGSTTTTGPATGPTDPTDPTNPDDPNDPGNPSPNDPGAPSGGNSTGVGEDMITIGIHAPTTGAAPVPSDSVQRGKDLYFKWIQSKGQSINGRQVRAVLKNDQYSPSGAVAVCREMVEKDKVFLLAGSAGTDQIAACAGYAESVGVPYISAGVTEVGLSAYRNYFAISMTYPDQAPLLADYMETKLGARGERNGLVYFDTANFRDAIDAFKRSFDGSIVYEKAVSKNSGEATARQVVTDLKTKQLDTMSSNVFVLTSPTFFIDMLKIAEGQSVHPQWTGVGITMTFDTVAAAGCNSLGGGKFFSPFPAWVDSDRYDPDFRRAAQQFYNTQGDDFMWLAWVGTKAYAALLKLPGKNLTRERFVYFAERARNLNMGVGPVLNFSPDDHFGADSTYVSQADCGRSPARWVTLERELRSDF